MLRNFLKADMIRFSICVILYSMCFVFTHALENRTRAIRDLTDVLIHFNSRFNPPNYKYRGLNTTDTNVFINVNLRNLIDFDVSRSLLKLYGLFTWRWKDETLQWNFNDFDMIEEILLPKNRIWFPSLYITNTAEGTTALSLAESVTVNFRGEVRYETPQIIDVLCHPDVYKYPYDVHICAIKLAPLLVNPGFALTITDNEQFLFKNFWNNSVWDVSPFDLITKDSKYVNIYIKLSRFPFFLMLNLVAPVLILAIMNMFVFALPHDSGEKISFSITMLLSFVVFISFTIEELPESSSSVCVFNIFLSVQLVESTLIALTVIMLSRLHHKSEEEDIPDFLLFIVCQPRQTNDLVVRPLDAETEYPDSIDKEKADKSAITWKKVAAVINGYCFMLFAFISLLEKGIVFGIILS